MKLSISIKIDPELLKRIEYFATSEIRTRNNMIEKLLDEAIKNRKNPEYIAKHHKKINPQIDYIAIDLKKIKKKVESKTKQLKIKKKRIEKKTLTPLMTEKFVSPLEDRKERFIRRKKEKENDAKFVEQAKKKELIFR